MSVGRHVCRPLSDMTEEGWTSIDGTTVDPTQTRVKVTESLRHQSAETICSNQPTNRQSEQLTAITSLVPQRCGPNHPPRTVTHPRLQLTPLLVKSTASKITPWLSCRFRGTPLSLVWPNNCWNPNHFRSWTRPLTAALRTKATLGHRANLIDRCAFHLLYFQQGVKQCTLFIHSFISWPQWITRGCTLSS